MDRKSLFKRLRQLAKMDPVYLAVSDYELDEALDDIQEDNTINSVFDIDPYYT